MEARDIQMNDTQGNTSGEQGLALEKKIVVYPFLSGLVGQVRQTPQPGVIVLISLDDGQNAVFAFGAIRENMEWAQHAVLPQPADALSGCVEPYDELEAIWHGRPVTRRRALIASVNLAVRSEAISLGWKLEPTTLLNCVDKRNAAIGLTAALPDSVQMLLIYDIEQLPYPAGTFALQSFLGLWQLNPNPSASATERTPILKRSTLVLSPNGRDADRSTYTARLLSHMRAVDAAFQDEVKSKAIMIEFKRDQ